MSKTVAELRAESQGATLTPRRTDVVRLCLRPDLVGEIQALTAEHDRLESELPPLRTADDDEQEGPPSRVGGEDPEVKQKRQRIAARLDWVRGRMGEIADEMETYSGDLAVRANVTDGEWRRWVNDHPARAEGEPGHDRDESVTAGFCNADDLIDRLGAFVHTWADEPLTADDWTMAYEPRVGNADKADIAMRIVTLYEGRMDFQRLRSALSVNLKRLNGSGSPATSASPTSGSTDGSPDLFSEASTETAAE